MPITIPSGRVAATSDWGTERRNAVDLLDHALNNRLVQVKDYDSATKTERVNQEQTEAANEKLARIKSRFSPWIWEDAARAGRYLLVSLASGCRRTVSVFSVGWGKGSTSVLPRGAYRHSDCGGGNHLC